MAETDIITRFGADIGPLKKGVTEAQGALSKFGTGARKTANDLGKVAGAAALAGAAIATKLVSNSLNAIDAQAKLAKQLNTSSASIATLDRAASMSGISLKNIEQGAKNLEVAMGEAAQGTGLAVDTLEKLGLTAESLEGMTLDQKILTVNQAIKENIPATQQAAAAADLFGKKAGFAISQLDPATISEAKREVVGFGVALSDMDAAKIERANDAMGNIGLAVTGVSNQFTVALAPILEAVANDFKTAAIESGGFRDEAVTAIDAIASAVGFLGNAFRGVEVIIQGLKVGFEGLSLVVNIFVTKLVEGIDSGVQYAMASINNLIDAANMLPSVDISKLVVGKSALAESMRASLEGAKVELGASVTELNNLLLQPLPSDMIEARLESIRANAQAEVDIERQKQEEIKAGETASQEQRLAQAQSFGERWKAFNESFKKEDKKGTQQFFSDLATLTSSGNKKLFEIGKIAARANVVIDTNEAAMKAYNWAAKWGGPVAGGVAAGAAILAGGARLSAINSTSFGSSSTPSAGAAASGGDSGASSQATSGQASAPQQERNLTISGIDSSSLYSGDQLLQLMENINGAVEDGYVLKAS